MPENTHRGGQSILLVEDDVVARGALVQILEELGFHIAAVSTVAEGIASLDGQHFAILDMELPDGLGTSVLEQIRTQGRPIRVAVATGTDKVHLIDEARRLRADLVLQKPVDLNALLDWLGHKK